MNDDDGAAILSPTIRGAQRKETKRATRCRYFRHERRLKQSTERRGPDGSSGGDTQTTGSATVRIVRPPVEPGGKPPLKNSRR